MHRGDNAGRVETTIATRVALVSAPSADYDVVVQMVPGTAGNGDSDGDVLTLPTTVPAGKTLVITLVPTGVYDINDRSDDDNDVVFSFTPP